MWLCVLCACVCVSQIKVHEVHSATSPLADQQGLPGFVVDYFFNTYGVKRLVQVKLRQLCASLRAHFRTDERVRLAYYGVVATTWHSPLASLSHLATGAFLLPRHRLPRGS